MKKLILFIGSLLVLTACQESLEEKAAKEAKTYTKKNCPWKISNELWMDSMTFDKVSHTFGYHYTMKGVLDDESKMMPEEMRQQLLDGVRNMTSARVYMNEGYAFQYVYRSEKNPEKILFETLFTAKDYQ